MGRRSLGPAQEQGQERWDGGNLCVAVERLQRGDAHAQRVARPQDWEGVLTRGEPLHAVVVRPLVVVDEHRHIALLLGCQRLPVILLDHVENHVVHRGAEVVDGLAKQHRGHWRHRAYRDDLHVVKPASPLHLTQPQRTLVVRPSRPRECDLS